MTYFPKTKVSGWTIIVPSIVLPLLYKDFLESNLIEDINKYWIDKEQNYHVNNKSLTLYLAIWRLCNLMTADLIEDKLGYEKNDLKLTDQLSSDLGVDSLDIVEIALYLEKIAGIPIHEGFQFEKISDLVDYIFSIMIRKIQKSHLGWPKTNLDILADW